MHKGFQRILKLILKCTFIFEDMLNGNQNISKNIQKLQKYNKNQSNFDTIGFVKAFDLNRSAIKTLYSSTEDKFKVFLKISKLDQKIAEGD